MINNSIQVFSFNSQEGSQVRTVTIDNEHWFVLRDVLAAMGSSTPTGVAQNSILDGLGDGYNVVTPIVDSLGRTQQVVVISEPAVTFLVARSNTELGKLLNRWIHKEVLPSLRKTGSYTMQPAFAHNLVWWERYMLYRNKTVIPAEFFSIFAELTLGLVADLEKHGYVLPINAVPDISVGRKFCAHLRTKGYDLSQLTKLYQHYYPDGRVVKANVYSVELLPKFRVWMQNTYNIESLPAYILKRDPQALSSLKTLLGTTEAELSQQLPRSVLRGLQS